MTKDEKRITELEQLILAWGHAYASGEYVKADSTLVKEYNKLYAREKEAPSE